MEGRFLQLLVKWKSQARHCRYFICFYPLLLAPRQPSNEHRLTPTWISFTMLHRVAEGSKLGKEIAKERLYEYNSASFLSGKRKHRQSVAANVDNKYNYPTDTTALQCSRVKKTKTTKIPNPRAWKHLVDLEQTFHWHSYIRFPGHNKYYLVKLNLHYLKRSCCQESSRYLFTRRDETSRKLLWIP